MTATSFHDWASVPLPAGEVDFPALAIAAGGSGAPGTVRVDGDTLYVEGVAQADLTKAAKDPTKVKPTVPQSVTAAQARIALLRANHLDMVETAVASDPEAKIWFEYATLWERQNPYVVDLGDKLLGGPDVVDALFVAAGQIAA